MCSGCAQHATGQVWSRIEVCHVFCDDGGFGKLTSLVCSRTGLHVSPLKVPVDYPFSALGDSDDAVSYHLTCTYRAR